MKQLETFRFELGIMECQPYMTDDEWAQVWQEIRDKYYVPINREPTDTSPTDIVSEEPLQSLPGSTPFKPKSQRKNPEPELADPFEQTVIAEQQPQTEDATNWSLEI
jgi:hypothetical protein